MADPAIIGIQHTGFKVHFPLIPWGDGLDPDFDFEESEKQEEQCQGKNHFQGHFREHFLSTVAKHTACKFTDDDGNRKGHVRKITGHQVADKGTDT